MNLVFEKVYRNQNRQATNSVSSLTHNTIAQYGLPTLFCGIHPKVEPAIPQL